MQQVIEQSVSFEVIGLIPPSVNHIYRRTFYTGKDGASHRGNKLTDEAKAFRDAVAIFARGRTVSPATKREQKKAKYRVHIDVMLGPGQRGDADNFNKSALDGLQHAGVIHSDNNVIQCITTVHRDRRDDPFAPQTAFIVERLGE